MRTEPLRVRDYMRTVRRYWIAGVAAVVVAIVAAVLTPGFGWSWSRPTTYRATAILVSPAPDTTTGSLPLQTLAYLTTTDAVASRVVTALGLHSSPRALAARIEATTDETTGTLSISTNSNDPAEAAQLANTFAKQLIEWRRLQLVRDAADLAAQIATLQKQIEALDARIESAPASGRDVLEAQRQAKLQSLGLLSLSYQTLISASADAGGLEIVQQAVATPSETALAVLGNPLVRVALGLLLGLLGGLGIAVVLRRTDTRIYTRKDAQERFGLPVLAEIPIIPSKVRDEIVALARPQSSQAESFRLLAAEVIRGMRQSGHWSTEPEGRPSHVPGTLLVTSAGPGEGKTTVVANLAVTLAELGKRVVVLGCDFRHPDVHRAFGLANRRGLSDVLASPNGSVSLKDWILPTFHPDVFVVPSGSGREPPAGLLSSERMRRTFVEVRRGADIVLIDSAPILAATDAAHLLGSAQAVLLVARSGKTRGEVAEKAAELLQRLGGSLIGVALNAATEITMPPGYRYYYRDPAASNGNGLGDLPDSHVTRKGASF